MTLDEMVQAEVEAARREMAEKSARATGSQTVQPGPTQQQAEIERLINIERLKRDFERGRKAMVAPSPVGPFSHGALQGLGAPATGLAAALGGELGEWFGGDPYSFGERYQAGEEDYREQLAAQQAKRPITSKVQEIAGSVVSAPPVQSAVTSIPGLVGRQAATGAGMGFVHGVGAGEGDWRDRLISGGIEAGVGAGLAGTLGLGSAMLAQPSRQAAARQAVGEAGQFNIPLTRGQATADPLQQRIEQELLHGQRGDVGGRRMAEFARQQEEARVGAAQDIRSRFAPSRGATGTESAADLTQGIRTRTQRLKAAGGGRIERALQQGVELDATQMRGLEDRITAQIAGPNPQVPDVILSENTPIANEAMARIRRFTEGVPDDPTVRVSMAGAEELRQRLSPLQAATPADNRALTAIKRAYNDWFDETVDIAATPGPGGTAPTAAAQELRRGRDLYRRGASLEEPRGRTTPAEKNVAKLASEEATAKDAFDLFRVDQRGGVRPEAARTIDRILTEFGPTSPTVQRIRDITMEGVLDGGPQRVATQIEGFLDRSRDVAERILTPAQIAELRRFANVSRQMVPSPTATNPSRTSYGVLKTLMKNALMGAGALIGSSATGGGVLSDVGGGLVGMVGGKALMEGTGAYQAAKAFNPIPETMGAVPTAMAASRIGAQQTPDRATLNRLMQKRPF